VHLGREGAGAVRPFLRAVVLAHEGEGPLPYEVEAVLLAKQFNVTPSMIEEEEDALVHVGLEGESVLKALAAREAFLGSGGKVRWTAAQGKMIVRIEKLLAGEDVEEEEREVEREYSDADLAGITVEG
jgi:hypothetical protein